MNDFRPSTWPGTGKKSVQAVRTSAPAPAQAEPPQVEPQAPEGPDATDAAKALAAEYGIDLATVNGSGSEGRITKDDVAALIAPEPETAPYPEVQAEPATGDDEPEQLEVV